MDMIIVTCRQGYERHVQPIRSLPAEGARDVNGSLTGEEGCTSGCPEGERQGRGCHHAETEAPCHRVSHALHWSFSALSIRYLQRGPLQSQRIAAAPRQRSPSPTRATRPLRPQPMLRPVIAACSAQRRPVVRALTRRPMPARVLFSPVLSARITSGPS